MDGQVQIDGLVLEIRNTSTSAMELRFSRTHPWLYISPFSGPAFIKLDHFDPWIEDQIGIAWLTTSLPLQFPNVCVI